MLRSARSERKQKRIAAQSNVVTALAAALAQPQKYSESGAGTAVSG